VVALTVNAPRSITSARAGIARFVNITTAEDAAWFALTSLTNVTDPITRETNFRNKRVNFVTSMTKENILRQNLPCKF